MTAGDDNDTTFEQPKRYFHLLNRALGWNEVSVYLLAVVPAAKNWHGR